MVAQELLQPFPTHTRHIPTSTSRSNMYSMVQWQSVGLLPQCGDESASQSLSNTHSSAARNCKQGLVLPCILLSKAKTVFSEHNLTAKRHIRTLNPYTFSVNNNASVQSTNYRRYTGLSISLHRV